MTVAPRSVRAAARTRELPERPYSLASLLCFATMEPVTHFSGGGDRKPMDRASRESGIALLPVLVRSPPHPTNW